MTLKIKTMSKYCCFGNLGNTCFLNAGLQFLNTVEELHHLNTGTMDVANLESALLQEYKDLLKTIDNHANPYNEIMLPNRFVAEFRKIGYALHPHGFMPYQQSDACEFISFLLDTLHEALKSEKMIHDLNPDLQNLYAKSNSELIPLFYGVFGTEFKMTMEDPAVLSTGRESFNIVHLPIPQLSTSSFTITELLQRFVEYEYIPTMNQYQFFRKRFLHLPPVLILSLKRFSAKGDQKNSAFVHGMEEPIDLGFLLTPSMPPTHSLYRLEAVINHFGNMNGGHYTAHIRRGSQWIAMDDARSFPLSPNKVVTSNAYCFLLRRFSLDI